MWKNKALHILSALLLSGTIIFASINFVLVFKSLYYYDIKYLHISEVSEMNPKQIRKNYSILIDYLSSNKINKLVLLDFYLTAETETHFAEVKKIFVLDKNLMYLFGILSLIFVFYNLKKKEVFFVKYASIILSVIPLFVIPATLSFNKFFTIFHNIFFNNDYWIIDPALDPIINIFPESFFFHCMIAILIILYFSSGLLYLIYKDISTQIQEESCQLI